MHVGIEPRALLVEARDQVHAVVGAAAIVWEGTDWRLDDTHWLHPVMTTTYNAS
jgi:hypothetical protein